MIEVSPEASLHCPAFIICLSGHKFGGSGEFSLMKSPYCADRDFSDNVLKMYRNPNVSVGLGLMYRSVLPFRPYSW